MQLITAKPSPYVRKVRVAVREKGLDVEEILDVPWNKDTVATVHNPLGKVPVLVLDDGGTVFDSSIIVEYLDTVAEPRLIPADPSARVAVRQLEVLCDGINDAVVLAVLETMRVENLQSQDWITRQMEKVDAGLKELARQAPDEGWLVGDHLTAADITAGCALGYLSLRFPDHPWRERHPELAAFSDKLEARPSFQATKPELQDIEPVT